jgi:phosphatidylethanolamine-binding protein (PEBP) family uncharacterized protein
VRVWNLAASGCAFLVLATAAGCGSSSSKTASVATAKPAKTATAPTTTNAFGEISLSSAAFQNGGVIPVRYTCDGADLSPPLRWQKIPPGAAQLFLIALELRGGVASGKGATIQWAVGDIQPQDGQIAAGALPPGAVVGDNSAGKAGWGGLCGSKGPRHHVAFLMYALRKKLDLKPGFDPTAARRRFKGTGISTGLTLASYRRS